MKTSFRYYLTLSIAGLIFVASPQVGHATHIRIVAANISSGNHQSYDPGEGIRIFRGLKPDVALIQEFNYKDNADDEIREFIDTAFGAKFSFFREHEATDQIPNGVITRFPILKSGEWKDRVMPNRDFAWARIDIPGDRELFAISVHLHNKKSTNRKIEAIELAEYIEDNVPASDYLVIGGDFNTRSRHEDVIETLRPLVSEKAAPVGPDGKSGTNAKRRIPYDWVLPDSKLEAFQVPVDFLAASDEPRTEGENSFSTGLVFDTRDFPHLERVKPARPSDSDAVNMQHMAVVKDFEVPDDVTLDSGDNDDMGPGNSNDDDDDGYDEP